jgi:NAD(P)-dependent dehydrogenase (short-subunit alcohol dehydrogenase family)
MPESVRGARAVRPSEVEPDTLRRLFETHVIGAVELVRKALPLLLASAAPRIVNVSSRLGSFGLNCDPAWPGRAVNQLGYSASKAALNMATLMLAHDLADTPIKINAASPGIVATDLNGLGAGQLAGRPGYTTPEQGAEIIISCAILPNDGPSGCFFGPDGVTPW